VGFLHATNKDQPMQVMLIFLKKGHAIPLHDHPGMFGIMKVVSGEMLVRQYSLTEGKFIKQIVDLQIILN